MHLPRTFYFSLLSLILLFSPIVNAISSHAPFNKMVFFGDSLSDNGNLYNDLLGFIPKSPPYFNGRFTNGPTWAEHVEKDFFNQGVVTVNYAMGGQTAIFHNPMDGYMPYTLTISLNNYLLHSVFSDRTKTLFVIWIGANDYLTGVKNMDGLTTDVTESIASTVDSLIYYQANNILLVNLPDFSKTPFGIASPSQEILRTASIIHNLKLDAVVARLQATYPTVNIHLYNANNLVDSFIEQPDVFNQKYKTHIKFVNTACWKGGYTLKHSSNNSIVDKIEQQLIAHLQTNQSRLMANKNHYTPNPRELANYIAKNPDLLVTYKVSSSDTNLTACGDPDDYVFWDQLHPSAVAHKLIAKNIIPFIEEHYEVLK